MKNLFKILFYGGLVGFAAVSCGGGGKVSGDGYRLVWSDEFNVDGPVDTTSWNFATGFHYNWEDQWYQKDNAWCEDGCLIIEARKERFPSPQYNPESSFWGDRREYVEYTSSRINTATKREFLYGRFEMRARIPVAKGAWPAFWTLGSGCEYGGLPWPQTGEIDIMEYYPINGVPHLLGNVASGDPGQFKARWKASKIPFSHFLEKDPEWAAKFHVWRMDWERDWIRLYIDDELINEVDINKMWNSGSWSGYNPHRHPHYILLNLALGGSNGGPIDDGAFPMRYEIDYVRVYQRQ